MKIKRKKLKKLLEALLTLIGKLTADNIALIEENNKLKEEEQDASKPFEDGNV